MFTSPFLFCFEKTLQKTILKTSDNKKMDYRYIIAANFKVEVGYNNIRTDDT